MTLPNQSHDSNSSLNSFLKNLEQHFSLDSSDSLNKNKKGFFARYTQSQFIGALTLVLLLVGAVTGVYLGEQPQDTRQQAADDEVYPTLPPDDGVQCDVDILGGNCVGRSVGNGCQIQGSGGTCIGGSPFGTGGDNSGICYCRKNAEPTATIPLDNGCSAKNGTCVAPGSSCPSNRHQDGLCSGAGSGPICCVPNIVVASATPLPTSTDVPQATTTQLPEEPTYTPIPPTGAPITTAPTQVIAPLCTNVTVNNPAVTDSNSPLQIGNQVTLRCATVATANRYEFRMKLPNNVIQNISPSTNNIAVSQQYTITGGGQHVAQCRPCIGTICAQWMN